MAYGPTMWSQPSELTKPRSLLEWNRIESNRSGTKLLTINHYLYILPKMHQLQVQTTLGELITLPRPLAGGKWLSAGSYNTKTNDYVYGAVIATQSLRSSPDEYDDVNKSLLMSVH